jgi:dihydropteroate synthase
MGVINTTWDSFSDDGIGGDPFTAISRAADMMAAGADILDVGGASTRPGADVPSENEEAELVLPVIEAISEVVSLPVSVDTSRASIADRALSAGASMVNDVTGLRSDPDMAEVIARHGAAVVVMHNQRGREHYGVLEDIRVGLKTSVKIAIRAGIDPGKIIVDPGFGFGWEVEQNIEILRRLSQLAELDLPILVGTSRKSTIGTVLNRDVHERVFGTAATVALAIGSGADVVRVHDVAEMRDVVHMSDAIARGFNNL